LITVLNDVIIFDVAYFELFGDMSDESDDETYVPLIQRLDYRI